MPEKHPKRPTAKNRYAKAIEKYYATLAEFEYQGALHEGAVSTAFQNLLADTARAHKWTLIPQLSRKDAGRDNRPDGTLKDEMYLVRGHWEAKDTHDDLDVEIAKKRKRNYPTKNIIFEDTRRAVLYQNNQGVLDIDLRKPDKLAELLDAFFTYIEPQIDNFEHAVAEFKEKVPNLARHLAEKIASAHKSNKKFQEAFDSFFTLCQTALNPNISQPAVDEMLIQHLLTERLIREVFDNPEFTRRNVIAAEVEKVIDALTMRGFNRGEFLRSLDRFYVAIENAARTMTEFADKQHFLNTVYERFFQGYSVKLADTHGIVYTPQPIVDFMCASVAEVLEKEFGKHLGHKDVFILDPCTGTGNFIVNLLRRVPKRDLPRVYREQLFANEIMLLPYYIAALNIEHAYYEQTGEYEPFEGLCFVDTLDMGNSQQQELSFMTVANTGRVERQRRSPITVIIGNPPYNANQKSENENNRNRRYPFVDRRISDTYVAASSATNKNKLGDPYIKFLRWASDRLGNRSGIVCFVSNNSFVNGKPFDGVRKHLLADFTKVYHLDLKGDAHTAGERRKREGGNIFSDLIRVGVGITIFVKEPTQGRSKSYYHAVPDCWNAFQKQEYLTATSCASAVKWQEIVPQNGNWLSVSNSGEFGSFFQLVSHLGKAGRGTAHSVLCQTFGPGLQTNRDEWVYDFRPESLKAKVSQLAETYNAEIDRWNRAGNPGNIDDFVISDERRIKWSSRLKETFRRGQYASITAQKFRRGLYRPFVAKFVLFDNILNHRPGLIPTFFPTTESERENRAIVCTSHSQIEFSSLMSSRIPDVHVGGRPGHCIPYYVYARDGTNRRENITDWALAQFRTHYKDKKITKWDIFYYVYGLLHHGGYRTKFADNLKRELPRIPLAPSFKPFAKTGKTLADLHLNYETLEPWNLKWVETPGVPLSYRVEKMKLTKDKTAVIVNDSLTLEKIPSQVFDYRLGNRSALEWVIDQYQTSTDKRSGITSDPNRQDDEQYIVRLIGQVVRVSVETVKLVNSLPDYAKP